MSIKATSKDPVISVWWVERLPIDILGPSNVDSNKLCDKMHSKARVLTKTMWVPGKDCKTTSMGRPKQCESRQKMVEKPAQEEENHPD
jgi:hypothetical protein